MADKAFRILLDVTDLYLENFKYVWINVSPRELKTISDLKKYVLRKIHLERDVQLFVRDGLLLDEETIIILREDDTVKIKYKTPVCENFEKESAKSVNFSRKRNLSENNVSDEDISSKRHKPEVVTLSSNGNEDNFPEKKSKKESRKKQIDSSKNPEKVFSTSVVKSKTKKVPPINSENVCCISVEEVKGQTGLSENIENTHSDLIEESQTYKKTHKKKKRKSSITYDQTVTDINSRKSNDLFYSFTTEFIPEKQKENKKTSKTVSLETEKYPVAILSNGSSSKEEEEKLSFHENESSSVAVNHFNSEELHEKDLSKTKSKRKRRRKRKKSAVIVENNSDVNVIDNSKSFSENIDENVNRKHILYLSPDRNQEVSCLKDDHEICNPSTSTFVLKEDKFPVIPLNYPKMSTPAQSNSCSAPDWQLSLMPSRNSNLSYNENDSILHDKSQTKNITSQSNRDNNSEELLLEDISDREYNSEKLLYEGLPDVTSLPGVGTCIAYKALELDDSYSPSVSNYREGVIERINPGTDEVEIRLNKKIILPGKSGKFENLRKDEVPEPIVITRDILKWSDIISPKLLSSLPE